MLDVTRILLALALAAPLVACSTAKDDGSASNEAGATDAGTGGAGTQIACDPLEPKAISLGQVVGVGKDAAGTLYVDSANGIFLSDGGKLIRQHVIGTGQSGDHEYTFSFVAPGADYSTERNLLVETTGNTADAMALGPDGKTFLDQPSSGITMLTLVDPSTANAMPLVNTPNDVLYLADVENGDVLLATRPMNEDTTSSDGGLAMFYGPPAAVAERVITSYQQALSGGGNLTFLVDGTPYVLTFAMVMGPDAGPLGTFTLQSLTPEGGASMAVTLRSPPPTGLPSDLAFTCFQ
jgi:hypothetical protein